MSDEFFFILCFSAVFSTSARRVCVLLENIPSEDSPCSLHIECPQEFYFNTEKCQCEKISTLFVHHHHHHHAKNESEAKVKKAVESCKTIENCKIGFQFNLQQCKCIPEIQNKILQSPKRDLKKTSATKKVETKSRINNERKKKLKCIENEVWDSILGKCIPIPNLQQKRKLKKVEKVKPSKPNYYQLLKSLNRKNGESTDNLYSPATDPKFCPVEECKPGERFSVMFCSCIALKESSGKLPQPPHPILPHAPLPNLPKPPRPLRAPCPKLLKTPECIETPCQAGKKFSFIICRCI